MKHLITVAFVVMYMLLNSICFADEDIIGFWSDKNNVNLYSFDNKGDFKYYHFAMNLGDDNSATIGDKTTSYRLWKGVFSRRKDICQENIQKGNMMIYVEEMQCCVMTQIIADKLVLTEVFSKGHEGMSICKDRVLNRVKTLPDVKEE